MPDADVLDQAERAAEAANEVIAPEVIATEPPLHDEVVVNIESIVQPDINANTIEVKAHDCGADCPEHGQDSVLNCTELHSIVEKSPGHRCGPDCEHNHTNERKTDGLDHSIEHKDHDHACGPDCPVHGGAHEHMNDGFLHSIEHKDHDHACGPDCPVHGSHQNESTGHNYTEGDVASVEEEFQHMQDLIQASEKARNAQLAEEATIEYKADETAGQALPQKKATVREIPNKAKLETVNSASTPKRSEQSKPASGIRRVVERVRSLVLKPPEQAKPLQRKAHEAVEVVEPVAPTFEQVQINSADSTKPATEVLSEISEVVEAGFEDFAIPTDIAAESDPTDELTTVVQYEMESSEEIDDGAIVERIVLSTDKAPEVTAVEQFLYGSEEPEAPMLALESVEAVSNIRELIGKILKTEKDISLNQVVKLFEQEEVQSEVIKLMQTVGIKSAEEKLTAILEGSNQQLLYKWLLYLEEVFSEDLEVELLRRNAAKGQQNDYSVKKVYKLAASYILTLLEIGSSDKLKATARSVS